MKNNLFKVFSGPVQSLFRDFSGSFQDKSLKLKKFSTAYLMK